MYPDLNGKTAVVTGASVGLGHGIARRFLQEGMSVVVNFHSDKHRGEAQKLADEFNAPGETAHVVLVQADISQEDGAPKLREAALEHFGGIDVWVNNAGIESRHPTHELPLDVWEKTLAVNLSRRVSWARRRRSSTSSSRTGKAASSTCHPSTSAFPGPRSRTTRPARAA